MNCVCAGDQVEYKQGQMRWRWIQAILDVIYSYVMRDKSRYNLNRSV